MALNKKESGFDLTGRLSRVKKDDDTPAVTPTPTPTPTYTPAHSREPKVREKKTERLQLVVRPSTKSRLAKYAQDYNTSSNEVVQKLLDQLLEESGY